MKTIYSIVAFVSMSGMFVFADLIDAGILTNLTGFIFEVVCLGLFILSIALMDAFVYTGQVIEEEDNYD